MQTRGELYFHLEGQAGAWNMAFDEWMLLRAIHHNEFSLRFYRWSEPTLSLGYFQAKTELQIPDDLKVLPTVRRLSGGGAILHDRELTYSIAVPVVHPWANQPTQLYRTIHDGFISVLEEHNYFLKYRDNEQSERNQQFLCFLRGDRNDLLIEEQKVLGSAQRRRKGAILQHGSLILGHSPHASQLLGLNELQPQERILDLGELSQQIADKLHKNWHTHTRLDESQEKAIEEHLPKYEL